MQKATPETPYKTRDDLARRRVLEETVVVQLSRHAVYGLDDQAAWVLEALQHPRTVPELCERVLLAEDTQRAAVARSLEGFVAELVSLELVAEYEVPRQARHPAPPPIPALSLEAGLSFEPSILWTDEIRQGVGQTMSPGEGSCGEA